MNTAKEMPMSISLEVSPSGGHQRVFQPGEPEIRWLGLEVLRLEAGEDWQGNLGDEEVALVILSGQCTILVEGTETIQWEGLGTRQDVFSGPATTVYVPRRNKLKVTAERRLELAVAKAPSETDLPPVLIPPEQVKVVSVGVANWRRDVRIIIPPGSPISQRLTVGETLNPPGNWSGIPPHKHDRMADQENVLEEFYFYKVTPVDSFGIQMIYGDLNEEVHIIENDDVVVFLSGYHPTVAAPGTTVFYLWALSGNEKAYKVGVDPRFQWVNQAEAVFNETQR